jgi:hypothetical protein
MNGPFLFQLRFTVPMMRDDYSIKLILERLMLAMRFGEMLVYDNSITIEQI